MRYFVHIPRILAIATILQLLTGCALLKDAARANREAKNAVEKGQTLTQPDGLYSVIVPDDYMYAIFDPKIRKLTLSYRDMAAFVRGPYYVIPWTSDNLPPEAKNNLETAFSKTVMSDVQRVSRGKLEVLKQTRTTWKGSPAIYHEWFIPGEFRNGPMGLTVIDMNNFAYAGLFVEKESIYFWITHCDPIEQRDLEKTGTKITQKIREDFTNYLEGATLLPGGSVEE